MTDLTHDEIDADLATHRPEGRDPDVAWLVVRASAHIVESYAWGYTVRIQTDSQGWGEISLCVVVGRPGAADAHERAVLQCDRFASGLYRAWVCDSYAEAYAAYEAALGGEEA